MTRYTVVWNQLAEDQLAQLWLDATDRPAITDAANMIDRDLARDPDFKGELVERPGYACPTRRSKEMYT